MNKFYKMKFDEDCRKCHISQMSRTEPKRVQKMLQNPNLFSLKHIKRKEIMKEPHNCKVKCFEIRNIILKKLWPY